ncbi:MAG: DMT family transporter [Pseudomonadota bacterium]
MTPPTESEAVSRTEPETASQGPATKATKAALEAPAALASPVVTGRRRVAVVAVALMLLAASLLAAIALIAKALGTGAVGPALHPLQIANARFVFALIAVVVIIWLTRTKLTKAALPIHFARAVCGFIGVTTLFAAAAMIPLSDATAISLLGPVFTLVLAAVFLREHVGPVRWFAALVGLFGAFVLLRPGAGAFEVGAALALISAFVMGIELTLIKRLTMREGVLQILLYANLFSAVFSTVAVVPVWQTPTLMQWLPLVAVGVLMMIVQMCYARALSMADASFVAPIGYTALVFAALYDLAIFNVVPDWVSALGAALILTGAITLAVREARGKV